MAKNLLQITALTLTASLLFHACTIVKPGETGVKRKLGKLSHESYEPGVRFYNPFLSRILRIPTRTVNREVKLPLPSREGLTIQSEISILYRIDKLAASEVIRNIGMN